MALDKKLHLAAGLLIAILAGYFIAPVWGLAAAVFAGFMKEVRDWGCYRGFDRIDMFATWFGGLIGYFIMEAIK